ncbi:Abi family protein [Adlercreutzia sp. ZJ141]|uniref:Abi family protein n=1 Tax=Adlercreutzia sp. ZJ141 TaxID=2709406 RepID=UPI0013E9AE79|nr:Abi family protein [Adlercreutzia sp. ZJ141]
MTKADGNIEESKPCKQPKPKLTADEQIAHLKSKGVKFELCSEQEARTWLTTRAFYFQIASYRVLFEKYVGGKNDGKYINLDFGNLVMLYRLDGLLRETLFPLTQDVEHAAAVGIVKRVTEKVDEDGYVIVEEYMQSLSKHDRNRREHELIMLSKDAYSGALVEKYGLRPPVWVLAELLTFGAFIDFYLFCARRWDDKTLLDEHYLLRQSKMVRNATAHGSAILNGLSSEATRIQTNNNVSNALAEIGISPRQRSSKMKNPRLQQIASLLYLHKELIKDGELHTRATKNLAALCTSMAEAMKAMPKNDVIRSSLGFLVNVTQAWFQDV